MPSGRAGPDDRQDAGAAGADEDGHVHYGGVLPDPRRRYNGFDIILDRVPRIFQLYITRHAPCGALFWVTMHVDC